MSMNLRYWGAFRSVRGDLYRIEILQEDGGIHFTPEQIGFAYDEPAEIEWSAVDKLEPVQGSCLTLTLDSDRDRRFLDLYTVEVGTIRADVYRNGNLYWSGLLDPELYEEPFSEKQNYDVSISFSDFAILDRKNWDGTGIYSVQTVIDTCLSAAGFSYGELVKNISTKISDNAALPLTFDEVYIVGENFYDEEGEPMTMREALEETLRPFALRLVQKNGRVYLHDLNALHALSPRKVIWADVDASLEADNVYNNVKVTFSPYADGALVDGTLDYDTVLQNQPEGSGELIRTDNRADSADGFRIVRGSGSESAGTISTGNGAVLFRIDPEYSGNKEAGVLWGYRPGDTWRGNAPASPYDGSGIFRGLPIIRTQRRYIGLVPHPEKYQLKITLEVLFDVRYNPFEPKARKNEEGNWDRLQNWCNYGYIPMRLKLYDAAGKLLYFYSNDSVRRSNGYIHGANCTWKSGIATGGQAWLCYYDKENRKSATGFAGWQTNKPIIGWYDGGLPSKFKVLPSGEYIPLPPANGFLELEIDSGLVQYDNDADNREKNIYSRARWLMYKNPTVEIVKANGRDIDKVDIEDSAWLNKGAKEGLEIDTLFGTMPEAIPSARGLLLRSDGTVYSRFSRAGRTDRLERLLIGTVYSQYAVRQHVLSGTARLLPDFSVLTDGSEPGQYVLLSEIQHLMQDEGEIKMVRFEADDYEGIEYKNG